MSLDQICGNPNLSQAPVSKVPYKIPKVGKNKPIRKPAKKASTAAKSFESDATQSSSPSASF